MGLTTRAGALQVLASVKKEFAAYIDPDSHYGPTLVKNFDWSGHAPYAIVWEEGPYEWAILATSGGVDEELTELRATMGEYVSGKMTPVFREPVATPPGVFLEPMTSWALGIYKTQEGR